MQPGPSEPGPSQPRALTPNAEQNEEMVINESSLKFSLAAMRLTQRYRPPDDVLDKLLFISGYLSSLGPDNLMKLAPQIKNTVLEKRVKQVQKLVKIQRDEIDKKYGQDDDVRLTMQLSLVQSMIDEMRDEAQNNPAIAEVLNETREYDFNEFLPGGKKQVTLDGMVKELSTPTGFGILKTTPCMNYLSGQVQDYASWLANLPSPPPPAGDKS